MTEAGPDLLAGQTSMIALELPPECVPGVAANLALLAEHWRNLEGFVAPESGDE